MIPDLLKKSEEIENEVKEYMTSLEEETEILKIKPNFMAQLESSCTSLFTKAQQAKQECKTKGHEDITLCSQYSIANKRYREYKESLLFLKYGVDIKAQSIGNVTAFIMMTTMQQMAEEIEAQKIQQNTSLKKQANLFKVTN